MNGTIEREETRVHGHKISELPVTQVERMYHCRPEELTPDMLVRDTEELVIPSWEEQ